MPKISAEGGTVVFEFDPIGGDRGPRLVIRCDDKGDIRAWITTAPEAPRS